MLDLILGQLESNFCEIFGKKKTPLISSNGVL